jgi:hypothetical protein
MKKMKERANKCIDPGGIILKNKSKLCPYKKLSVFYNSCIKTFGPYLVCNEYLLTIQSTPILKAGILAK